MVTKNELNEKLDKILKNQQKILANEEKILGEEEKIEKMEYLELQKEDLNQQTEQDALAELVKIEKELAEASLKPLKKITKKDLFKGFIGAFVGIVSHFAFSKGADLGKELSLFQATVIYIMALIIIIVMLYYTGYRKVEKQLLFKLMPSRAIILYSVSLFTVFIVFLIFGKIYFPLHAKELYTLIAPSMILAVIGAGTADLIGRSEGH